MFTRNHSYLYELTFDCVKSFPGSHQSYFYFVTDYAREMMEELFHRHTVDRENLKSCILHIQATVPPTLAGSLPDRISKQDAVASYVARLKKHVSIRTVNCNSQLR